MLRTPEPPLSGEDGEAARKLDEMEKDACADAAQCTTLSVHEKFELLAMAVYAGAIGADGDNDMMIYDKAEIISAVELAMDKNGDGTMSCDEFNKAYASEEAAAFVNVYLGIH